jgi:hypothetical protein
LQVPPKNYPNLESWFENMPSNNPDTEFEYNQRGPNLVTEFGNCSSEALKISAALIHKRYSFCIVLYVVLYFVFASEKRLFTFFKRNSQSLH